MLRKPNVLARRWKVAVDVQDVCTVLLGVRGDDQVRQQNAMLPARGQLTVGCFRSGHRRMVDA